MKKKSLYLLLIASVVAASVISSIFFLRDRPSEPIASDQSSTGFPGHPSTGGIPSKTNVNEAYTERIEGLKKAVEVHPRNTDHLAMLARLLMDGHQAPDAIPYFERALRIQPKNDSLLLDLSVCYSIAKKYDAALALTDRLLLNDPHNLNALYNKGALLATMGKNAEAARWWKKIIAAAPASEEAKKAQSALTMIGI